MEQVFDTLIDSFIANQVGISENFLSESLAFELKKNLTVLYENQQFKPAGIGNDVVVGQDKAVRSDHIYWLDRQHNDEFENHFFDLMDLFVAYLNRTCYTNITDYEFHYARYDKGSFYKTHLDQFKSNDSRQYSMIMYLNSDWELADGGQLCIYPSNEASQTIDPTNGKSVFFKSSELLHEVLLTHKPRLSITGWLKIKSA